MKCLKDHGNFEIDDGTVILLKKNSQVRTESSLKTKKTTEEELNQKSCESKTESSLAASIQFLLQVQMSHSRVEES